MLVYGFGRLAMQWPSSRVWIEGRPASPPLLIPLCIGRQEVTLSMLFRHFDSLVDRGGRLGMGEQVRV